MVQNKKITTLFLDIGGVLLTNGWDNHSRSLAVQQFHLDETEFTDRHNTAFDVYESGKMNLDEYLNLVVFYEKRTFSKDEFKSFMFSQSQPYSDTIDLFIALKNKYLLKIYAVSNEVRELNEYRIRTFNLNKIFDVYVSSCYVHYRKPDLDIYRTALDMAQVPISEIVYIDDRKIFVEVACTLGLKGIHHKDIKTTKDALQDLGLSL